VILLTVFLLTLSTALAEDAPKAWYPAQVPPPFPPERESVGDEYFEDAVFIGDSAMDDIEMLNLFPTGNFACLIGMSPLSASRRQFRVKGSDVAQNVYEVTKQYPHKKIIILLGGNSLDHKPSKESMEDYTVMIDQMIADFPESVIYVLSPLPMTEKYMTEKQLPPRRFSNFRESLIALAAERNLYFLDLYPELTDEGGYMRPSYNCGDGVHLNRTGYEVVERIIRTHMIDVE